MKALILEDEPDLLADYGKYVKQLEPKPILPSEKSDFQVDGAKSAAEAKELLRKAGETQPYDVMLLDLSVPENRGTEDIEQGLDVLKLAQEERGAREVVVVSGNKEGMNRARRMGARHFVNKQGFQRDDLKNKIRIVVALQSGKILENRTRELARQSEHSLVYHFGLCFSRCLQEITRAGDAIEGELHDNGDALMHQVAGLRQALKSGRQSWAELQTSLGLDGLVSPEPISIRTIVDDLKQKLGPCLVTKNARASVEGDLEATVLNFNGDVMGVLSEMILGGLADNPDYLYVPDDYAQAAHLVISCRVNGDWVEIVLQDKLPQSFSKDDVQKINEDPAFYAGRRFGRAWGLATMQHVALRGGGRLIVEMPEEGNRIKYRIPRAHNA